MDAEQTFAAEVFRAEQDAAKVCARGHPQTTSDIVTSALIDLWGRCAVQGLSSKAIQAIADKYVRVDESGKSWPRAFDRGNVVALHGK
jgi:hypothetical protein